MLETDIIICDALRVHISQSICQSAKFKSDLLQRQFGCHECRVEILGHVLHQNGVKVELIDLAIILNNDMAEVFVPEY